MAGALEIYSCPSLTITNCVTVKLTERNYILWKLQFEFFLSGQSLLGFVDGSQKVLATTIPIQDTNGNATEVLNPDFQAWRKSDQVVKSWILGLLSKEFLSLVVGCAHDIWYALSKHFNRISSSRLFELQRRSQTLSKDNKTMIDYLTEVKSICDQLTVIGNPVSEKMEIFAAIHGPNREYESIVTVIENAMDIYPGPSFEDVVSKLTGFIDRIKGYSNAASTVNALMAFKVDRSNSYGQYNNRGRGQT